MLALQLLAKRRDDINDFDLGSFPTLYIGMSGGKVRDNSMADAVGCLFAIFVGTLEPVVCLDHWDKLLGNSGKLFGEVMIGRLRVRSMEVLCRNRQWHEGIVPPSFDGDWVGGITMTNDPLNLSLRRPFCWKVHVIFC